MNVLKKTGKFLSSMTFAIILLVILAAVCAAGSFITQGQTYEWYAEAYSENAAAWIMALHLNDTFHSVWFIVIALFLCGNLLLCNVLRFKALIKRARQAGQPQAAGKQVADASADMIADPKPIFEKLRMPKPKEMETDGKNVLFSVKNRAGFWGAWFCHLGILLLILGFGLGQMTKTEYTVYGVPGQMLSIGDTGLFLHIDDFRINLREDDTVEQYTADITVFRAPQGVTAEPDIHKASVSVNHPGRMFGMTFYQNATGWAARVTVEKNGKPLQSEIVCAGEYLPVADLNDLVICFNAFYPDYVSVPGGMPMTASSKLNNPGYLYSVYYKGNIIGMNVLLADEQVTIDDYKVTFADPQSYTLIQIKKDSFTWLAFIGGIVTMIGLFLAFYLQPQTVYAVQEEDGTWTVSGICKKGGTLYREIFLRAVQDAGTGKRGSE